MSLPILPTVLVLKIISLAGREVRHTLKIKPDKIRIPLSLIQELENIDQLTGCDWCFWAVAPGRQNAVRYVLSASYDEDDLYDSDGEFTGYDACQVEFDCHKIDSRETYSLNTCENVWTIK